MNQKILRITTTGANQDIVADFILPALRSSANGQIPVLGPNTDLTKFNAKVSITFDADYSGDIRFINNNSNYLTKANAQVEFIAQGNIEQIQIGTSGTVLDAKIEW